MVYAGRQATKIYAAVLIRGTFSAVTIPDIGMLLLEFDVADVLGTEERAGSDQSVYYMVDPQGEFLRYTSLPNR